MLPPAHRLRRSADFASTVRSGRRIRRGHVVVHHRRSSAGGNTPAVVGFVVGRVVGGSVVRHRTARRLRALVAARLEQLPAGSATVVRALAGSGDVTSGTLGADLDRALGVLTDAGRRS